MHRSILMGMLTLFAIFANAATPEENLRTCLSGKYDSLCNYGLLTPDQNEKSKNARRVVNLNTCISGKYKALCKHSLLSQKELSQVIEAERQVNLNTCISGAYSSLCNHTLLTEKERIEVSKAERVASKKATSQSTSSIAAPAKTSRDSYLIEVVHDDLLIINGEKYEAQSYCYDWGEGEEVIFLEGSPYGACATAILYNLSRRQSCDVWCE